MNVRDNDGIMTVDRYFSIVLNSCKVLDKSLDRFFGAWIELLIRHIITQSEGNCISYTYNSISNNQRVADWQ